MSKLTFKMDSFFPKKNQNKIGYSKHHKTHNTFELLHDHSSIYTIKIETLRLIRKRVI
jgi:hypothetical protein